MVNLLEHIQEPLWLEGEAYSIEGLRKYCGLQAGDPGVPAWKKELFAFVALFLDPDEEAITQQSSGTTGDPKSFVLSRDAMLSSARRTLDFFGLRAGEKALLCLPVHYIAGKMMVVRALLGGLDLLLREPSSRPLQDLEEAVRFAAMVPLQMVESLRHGDPLGKINILLMGGGELHPATRDRLSSFILPEVYETFGMTETYTHFALRRINGPLPDTAFRVLEGVQIRRDSRDCLEVEVPGVTSEPIQTNDLVEIHEEGSTFTWQGRYDNLINTGGIKIIPELLEDQVRKCLGHECLVLSEADPKLGNRLVLLVEYQGEEPPLDHWEEQLRNRLSNYEIPKRIIAVGSLPRNPSMKPDRTSARELLL
jgi:O-succinylbenzoic acid--CoA ligase